MRLISELKKYGSEMKKMLDMEIDNLYSEMQILEDRIKASSESAAVRPNTLSLDSFKCLLFNVLQSECDRNL